MSVKSLEVSEYVDNGMFVRLVYSEQAFHLQDGTPIVTTPIGCILCSKGRRLGCEGLTSSVSEDGARIVNRALVPASYWQECFRILKLI